MKKYNPKKGILLLPALALLVNHATLLPVSTQGTVVASDTENSVPEQKSRIRRFVEQATLHIHRTKDRVKNIFNNSNHDPLSAHVRHIHNELDALNKNILTPLENEIALLENNSQDDYKKILSNMLDIVKTLHKHLNMFHKTLDASKNMQKGEVVKFASALLKVEGLIEQDIDTLDRRVHQLHVQLLRFDDELAKTVQQLRAALKVMVEQEDTGKLAMLGKLRHRLGCS